MNREEILAFINENPVAFIATSEGNQPHVRGILTYKADENGILFHTGKMKDFHIQLQNNPQIELCFNKLQEHIQIRVSGEAELVEDLELKKEIVTHPTREFLRPMVEKQGYDFLAVYRVTKLKATVWTFATNLAPKAYIAL